MQNRYVGDVGDFGKYGLLRRLVEATKHSPPLRLGVVWYLFQDEVHNNDGAKVQYLTDATAAHFENCDPDLFRKLRFLVSRQRRAVGEIRRHAVLPKTTRFFDAELTFSDLRGPSAKTARLERRATWLARALQATVDCDVVFMDPDNGLECKSVRPHDYRGPKYIFRDELLAFIDRGQTLIVYHHTCRRESAQVQIRNWLERLAAWRPETVNSFAMRFRRGGSRAFLVVPAERHSPALRNQARMMLTGPWGSHFEFVGDTRR